MDAQFNHLQLNQAQQAARDLAQRRLRVAVDHFQGAGVTLTAGGCGFPGGLHRPKWRGSALPF